MPLRRVCFLQGSYCEMYSLEFMGRSFISVIISSCGTSQRLTCTYRSRARALHQDALSQRGHPIIGTWEGDHREALSRPTYYSSQNKLCTNIKYRRFALHRHHSKSPLSRFSSDAYPYHYPQHGNMTCENITSIIDRSSRTPIFNHRMYVSYGASC